MAFLAFLNTIVLPIVLAGALYGLLTLAILPLYRRHHQRYAQYLPLPLNSISTTTTRTSSFLRDHLPSFLRPSSWGLVRRYWKQRRTQHAVDIDDDNNDANSLFGSEEGEGMVGFDVDDGHTPNRNRVPAQPAHPSALSDRRLSRELEEGFRDDSEDEEEGNNPANTGRIGTTR